MDGPSASSCSASAGDESTWPRRDSPPKADQRVPGRERDEDVHGDDRAAARRRGRSFGLSSTLEGYLPGVVPRGKEITIRQLLQHRSGLANDCEYASGWSR